MEIPEDPVMEAPEDPVMEAPEDPVMEVPAEEDAGRYVGFAAIKSRAQTTKI